MLLNNKIQFINGLKNKYRNVSNVNNEYALSLSSYLG